MKEEKKEFFPPGCGRIFLDFFLREEDNDGPLADAKAEDPKRILDELSESREVTFSLTLSEDVTVFVVLSVADDMYDNVGEVTSDNPCEDSMELKMCVGSRGC